MKFKIQLFLIFFWYCIQTEAQIFHNSTFFAISKTNINDQSPPNIFNNQNTLHQYNAITNQWHLIGKTGASNIDAIAMDNIRKILYAANGGILGTLNTLSGAFASIGTTNYGNGELGRFLLNNIDGLTFCSLSNTLYAIHHRLGDYEGSNDLLFKINPSNGQILELAMKDSKGNAADYAVIEAVEHNTCCKLYGTNDLALNPFTHQLYTIQSDKDNNEVLTIIDVLNAEISSVVYNLKDYDSNGLTFSYFGELFGSSELTNRFLIINTEYQFVQPLSTFDFNRNYTDFNSIAYAGPYLDLALKITLHADEQPPFVKNDIVTCSITIYNQGEIEVDEIELVNYIGNSLSVEDSTWVSENDERPITKKILYSMLAPNDSLTTQIQLKVDKTEMGNLMNSVEILSAKNNKVLNAGFKVLSLSDIDSAYDGIEDNEIFIVDDEINQYGQKVSEDEDDHDIVMIEVNEFRVNCINDLDLMGNLLNTGTYQAAEEIKVNTVVSEDVKISLKAGNCISLFIDFEVEKGGDLEADIVSCE